MGGRVLRLVAGWLVTMGVALGVSLWAAAPAAAHNSLTGSNPADGARLAQAPTRIELRFLARLDPNTTKITVTGPDNAPASRGTPTVDGSRVSVAFVPGAAGQYTVEYQVQSADGHPVRGDIEFTLTTGVPSASPTATTPSATPVEPSPAAPSATASPDAVPAADTDSGTPRWLWGIGALALLAALLAGLLARRRSRRPTD